MKEEIKKQVLEHAENLDKVFKLGLTTDEERMRLCRRLKHLENVTHSMMEKRCNGTNETEAEQESWDNEMLNKINAILHFKSQKIPVFLNGDPRGYSLKIECDFNRELQRNGVYLHQDWGGYGIIAPDFS